MQNPPPGQGYNNPYGAPPPPYNQPSTGGNPGGKTSVGLESNLAAALAYITIVGIIFFFIEKENRFVRFHSMQSILFGAAITVLFIVLGIVTAILGMISGILATLFSLLTGLLGLGVLIVAVLCMIKAYQNQMFKLPVIGDMAENIINKQ